MLFNIGEFSAHLQQEAWCTCNAHIPILLQHDHANILTVSQIIGLNYSKPLHQHFSHASKVEQAAIWNGFTCATSTSFVRK